MIAGDVNEDGRPDLAITAVTKLYVFTGNGDGTFVPASSSPDAGAKPAI